MTGKFRDEVGEIVSKFCSLAKKEVEEALERPPEPEFGDLAFPCFVLSKKMKKAPQQIAKDLSEKINIPKDSLIEKIEPRGAYLNFFADWGKIGNYAVGESLKGRNDYGSGGSKKQTIMVEFCHANTHKAFHIGHVRNICLGESISRILEFAGYKVVRANYEGDIGPHVAKCIWGILNLYKGKEPEKDKGIWLGKVYAEASKKIRENEELKEEVEEINNKIYSKDPKIFGIWKKTRQWSLDYFDSIYRNFGVRFNRLYFESEVEKSGKRISEGMVKTRAAKISEGAIVVDLEKYGLGVCVLVTQQGNPLYHAKDLGLAELKAKEFSVDKSVHVVGSEQKLYFEQLFKTFELIKSPMARISYHLCYELVTLKTGKMASREGVVILYENLLNELKKHALEETKKRNPKMGKENMKKISEKIANAALKYDMLKIAPNKTIIFDWEAALDFEGNAAPYLLYTYARACSILRKSGEKTFKFNAEILQDKREKDLIKMISEFSETVEKAAADMRPHYIVNYAFNLSKIFNEFYQFLPVLKAEKELRSSRLALVKSVSVVLKNSMGLLGIDVLESM
jgi:arginyl-tRNA synthetase